MNNVPGIHKDITSNFISPLPKNEISIGDTGDKFSDYNGFGGGWQSEITAFTACHFMLLIYQHFFIFQRRYCIIIHEKNSNLKLARPNRTISLPFDQDSYSGTEEDSFQFRLFVDDGSRGS